LRERSHPLPGIRRAFSRGNIRDHYLLGSGTAGNARVETGLDASAFTPVQVRTPDIRRAKKVRAEFREACGPCWVFSL